jgi:hypothetical protein
MVYMVYNCVYYCDTYLGSPRRALGSGHICDGLIIDDLELTCVCRV